MFWCFEGFWGSWKRRLDVFSIRVWDWYLFSVSARIFYVNELNNTFSHHLLMNFDRKTSKIYENNFFKIQSLPRSLLFVFLLVSVMNNLEIIFTVSINLCEFLLVFTSIYEYLRVFMSIYMNICECNVFYVIKLACTTLDCTGH